MRIGESNIDKFAYIDISHIKDDYWYVVPKFNNSQQQSMTRENITILKNIFDSHLLFYKDKAPHPYIFLLVNKKDWANWQEKEVKKLMERVPETISLSFYDILSEVSIPILIIASQNFSLPLGLSHSQYYSNIPF